MVEHHHVVNLHYALQSTVFARCAARSGIGLNASIAFDSSLKSLTALTRGHRLILIPPTCAPIARRSSVSEQRRYRRHRLHAPTQLDVMLASGSKASTIGADLAYRRRSDHATDVEQARAS